MTALLPAPFYFLRHGVTDHNQRRLVMGQLDIPLNDAGRRQAEQAGLVLGGQPIGQILASPLARATETAAIIGRHLGLAVTVLEALRERDWGEMAGRSYRELMRADAIPAGAETLAAFSGRVLGALGRLAPGGVPLLVAHSGICRVLRHALSIVDDHRAVPHAVPLLFSPDRAGIWHEQPLTPPPDESAP